MLLIALGDLLVLLRILISFSRYTGSASFSNLHKPHQTRCDFPYPRQFRLLMLSPAILAVLIVAIFDVSYEIPATPENSVAARPGSDDAAGAVYQTSAHFVSSIFQQARCLYPSTSAAERASKGGDAGSRKLKKLIQLLRWIGNQ